MDFTSISTITTPTTAASAFNGNAPVIDVATPLTFISERNKLVTSADDVVSLRDSLAYAIYLNDPSKQGTPTIENVAAGAKRYGHIISIFAILLVLSKAKVEIKVRSSDVIAKKSLVGEGALMTDDMYGKYAILADKVYQVANSNPENMAKLASESKYVLLALFSNAIHREQCNGHNWMTDDTTKNGTVAKRATAVAAADVVQFADFMQRNGHDLWHFLTDNSLRSVVNALSGQVTATVAEPLQYNGVDVAGKPVHHVLDAGEAARDRWPIGNIGISGMMLGLTAVSCMVSDIGSKIRISNLPEVVNAVNDVKTYIKDKRRSRIEITGAKDRLSPVIAVALGYVSSSRHLNDTMKDGKSLESIGANHGEKKALGSTLSKRIAEIKADDQALSASVAAVVGEVSAALSLFGGYIGSLEPVSTRDAEEFIIQNKESEAKRKANVAAALKSLGQIEDEQYEKYESL